MERIGFAGGRLASMLDRGNLVKIDGLREPEHAAAAVAAGVDLIGFIFAKARRQVSAATARDCIAAARLANPNREFLAVGVFVDAAFADMASIVEASGVDAVQLHGVEPPESIRGLTVPAIKAMRPRPGANVQTVVTEIERYRTASVSPVGFLIDGFAAGSAGGTGRRADWDLAASVNLVRRVLLGGGLEPGNVGVAIRQVRPIGVDVSSGVEIDGVKDIALIEAFIHAARLAYAGLSGDRC